MTKDWRVRIEDMIEAVERCLDYVRGLSHQDFLDDIRSQDAVLRNLEVLGEASKRIPPYITHAYPQVPWSRLADMRNILVHEYHSVDPNIVLDTVIYELPPILPVLKQVLAQDVDE